MCFCSQLSNCRHFWYRLYLYVDQSSSVLRPWILWCVLFVFHVLVQDAFCLLLCQLYLLFQLWVLASFLFVSSELLVIFLEYVLLAWPLSVFFFQVLFYRRLWVLCLYFSLLLLLFELLWKWVLESLAVLWRVASIWSSTVLRLFAFGAFFILAMSFLIKVFVHCIKHKLLNIFAIHFHFLTGQNFDFEWTFSLLCLFLLHFNSDRSTLLIIALLKIIIKPLVKWSVGIKPLPILLWFKLETAFMVSIGFGPLSVQVHSESVWRFCSWAFWKMSFSQILWNLWISPFLVFSFCLEPFSEILLKLGGATSIKLTLILFARIGRKTLTVR
jgi:hypothetical protein